MLLECVSFNIGNNTVKVPLIGPTSSEKLVVIVKSLGRDEFKVGSISIP